MAGDGKIQMPGGFGGLMRFDEEYESKLRISPTAVIGLMIALILAAIVLKVFWPVAA